MAVDPTKTWLYFVKTNHDGLPLMRAPLSHLVGFDGKVHELTPPPAQR